MWKKSKTSGTNQEHSKKSEKKETDAKAMPHSEESYSGAKPKGSRERKKETIKKPTLPHIREETIEMKNKQSQPSTSGAVVKTKDVIET